MRCACELTCVSETRPVMVSGRLPPGEPPSGELPSGGVVDTAANGEMRACGVAWCSERQQLGTYSVHFQETTEVSSGKFAQHASLFTCGTGTSSVGRAACIVCTAAAGCCPLAGWAAGSAAAAAGCVPAASASARAPRGSTNVTAAAPLGAAAVAFAVLGCGVLAPPTRGCGVLCADCCRLAVRWEVTECVRGCCGVPYSKQQIVMKPIATCG